MKTPTLEQFFAAGLLRKKATEAMNRPRPPKETIYQMDYIIPPPMSEYMKRLEEIKEKLCR